MSVFMRMSNATSVHDVQILAVRSKAPRLTVHVTPIDIWRPLLLVY